MGVKGLAALINSNPSLLHSNKLHDTKVVIDGNNLFHHLYNRYNVCKVYGGDYDHYSQVIKDFFGLLESCNVSPYVVFDGAHEKDDRKLQTVLRRARDRLREAGQISTAQATSGNFAPILSYETFRHALLDIGIPHVSCDYEADDQLVVLANEWRCPVISDDSDFYVFNIIGGYIPIKSIKLYVKSSKARFKYLSTKIYFSCNLVEKFPKLNDSMLPLMATVFGNDFTDERLIKDFNSTLVIESDLLSDLYIPETHTKLTGILHWIKNTDSLDQAIDSILSCIQPVDKLFVKSALEKSLMIYRTPDSYSSFSLREFFSGQEAVQNTPTTVCSGMSKDSSCQSDPDGSSSSALCCYNGFALPRWFWEAHRKTFFSDFMLNIITSHRIVLKCNIEDMNGPSAYECATSLRQIVYGILMKENKDEASDEESEESVRIEEYTRDKGNLTYALIQPLDKIFKYGCLPCLHEIKRLDHEQLLSLLLSPFEVVNEELKAFPENLRLVAATIMFWMRNSNPPVIQNNLKALLICILIMNMRQLLDGSRAGKKHIIEMAEKKFGDYFYSKDHSEDNLLDINTIHIFAQFQTCMTAAIHLNQLLMYPLPSPDPAKFFNGTFLYNFSKDLENRTNSDDFLSSILSELSLLNVYESWLSHMPNQIFSEQPFTLASRKTKVGKEKTPKRGKPDRGYRGNQEEDTDDMKDLRQKKKSSKLSNPLTLSNRFSALDIDASD